MLCLILHTRCCGFYLQGILLVISFILPLLFVPGLFLFWWLVTCDMWYVVRFPSLPLRRGRCLGCVAPHPLLHLLAESRLTLPIPCRGRSPLFVHLLIALRLAMDVCHALKRPDVSVRHDKTCGCDAQPPIVPSRHVHLFETRVESVQAGRVRSV